MMSLFRCDCKNRCTAAAVIAGIFIGVVVALLRLTGQVTIAPVALIVTFGIGVLYLAVALVTAALAGPKPGEISPALTTLLVGILGTILLSALLLGVTFAATSVVGALLYGALAYFFTQAVAATACWVAQLAD